MGSVSYISEFQGGKVQKTQKKIEKELRNIESLLRRQQIGGAEETDNFGTFVSLITALNKLKENYQPLMTYARLRLAVDASDREAAKALGSLEKNLIKLEEIELRLTSWLAELPSDFDAGEYALLLAESRVLAGHMMGDAEEILAAELSLIGRRAWSRLYGNVSSRMTVDLDDEAQPMAVVRNLAYDEDERVRRGAYLAELAAWKKYQDELAACLNGVKGEAVVLVRRRGWPDEIEPTLFDNRISRKTLEAMLVAVEDSLPVWRRYFAAKARLLGKEKLDWWDVFAPVGESREWSWDEARSFIVASLRDFSPGAAELAERAFSENWIDAEPRAGKRGGAFCAPVGGGASRVLANYGGSFDAVSTLAHELGHAYHNLRLAGRPPLLRRTPMTLAETASIMNETVVTQAALGALSGGQRLAVLDTWLRGAAQVVVDVYSRFIFESRIFEMRRQRELTPEEFSKLMVEAQQQAYGDALNSYHSFMWAVKPHYYGRDFYNYPYIFGLLFGLGLYTSYLDEPNSFIESYDALLADTGTADARELATSFGFDIEDPEFWRRGMGILTQHIDEFAAASET